MIISIQQTQNIIIRKFKQLQMIIYKNYIRYAKHKNINNLDANIFDVAINKMNASKLTLCEFKFLYEIYIWVEIQNIQLFQTANQFIQKSLQYLDKQNMSTKLQNLILIIQLFRKNWTTVNKYQLYQAFLSNCTHDQKLSIIIQKQYSFINKQLNYLLLNYIKLTLNNIYYSLDNIKITKYGLYLFQQLVQNIQDSQYLTYKYEYITQSLYKFYKMHKASETKVFVQNILNKIIEQKNMDFIKYFKFFLQQKINQEETIIHLVQQFCKLITLYQQKWKVRIFQFKDFIKMDYLAKYFYLYVYRNSSNTYPYFQKFLLEYTILHTQIPLILFIDAIHVNQSLQKLISIKSLKVYSLYLKNMHETSKFILNYYINKSNLNLKRYPSGQIVDPLHFLMVKSLFWQNQYDCSLLTSALYIALQIWLKTIQDKQIDINKKRKYKTQLSLIILQFLLTIPKSEILEYFPIENQLLSYLFTLPSFPTLAIKCEYFFKIAWSHMLRAYLPELIFFQNGFNLANLIFENWKGRICYEAAQSIINSINSQLNNNFQSNIFMRILQKNKKSLKQLLNNYKIFTNLSGPIKMIQNTLMLD